MNFGWVEQRNNKYTHLKIIKFNDKFTAYIQ